ncbi:hypothetical protein MJM59_27800, partial [Salmonella enterica subsp. enterica serovar Montevideo]|nr:hypothetical protein [Salmonella enterica subsp. enterica serovar Montevideo]
FLDWTITSALSANVNWTLYGKQKPRTHAESRSEETKGLSGKAHEMMHSQSPRHFLRLPAPDSPAIDGPHTRQGGYPYRPSDRSRWP